MMAKNSPPESWDLLLVREVIPHRSAAAPTMNSDLFNNTYNWSHADGDAVVRDSIFGGAGASTIALVSLYALVFLVGLVGNVLVVLALGRCNAGALPVRNNLLVNLCVADLLVTLVCVPVSVTSVLWKAWLFGEAVCKAAAYLQSVPVAASTLSLMMLSLDRYAAIRHPGRLFWRQRQLAASKAIIFLVWVAAALVSGPIVYVRRVLVTEEVPLCLEEWSSDALKLTYSFSYLLVVYVIPCLTVAVCHVSVGYKLCSANLVAAQERSRMQQMIRPKQVIIVAQDQATDTRARKIIPYDADNRQDSDDDQDGFLQMQIQADLDTLKRTAAKANRKAKTRPGVLGARRPRPPVLRATRHERSIIRAHRKLRRRQQVQVQQLQLQQQHRPSLLKTYSNQSFRSRRRLANLLVILVVVFVACWLPFIAVSLWEDLCPDSDTASALLPFALFLGHAHSAINPLVYWLLNRSFLLQIQRLLACRLLQRFCCCCHCCSCRRCRIRGGLCPYLRHCMPPAPWTKVPHVWRRNSSTNEAALGPFHPKYLGQNRNNYPLEHHSKCTSHFLR